MFLIFSRSKVPVFFFSLSFSLIFVPASRHEKNLQAAVVIYECGGVYVRDESSPEPTKKKKKRIITLFSVVTEIRYNRAMDAIRKLRKNIFGKKKIIIIIVTVAPTGITKTIAAECFSYETNFQRYLTINPICARQRSQ